MKTFFYSAFAVLLCAVSLNSQTNLIKYENNPVLEPTPGTWDAGGVGVGTVLYNDSQYKMWFYGHNGNYFLRIGYAESMDGLTWMKPSSNYILPLGNPGSFDEGSVALPSVMFDDGIYKMWYTGMETDPSSHWRIGYATSADGINWIKENNENPVLDLGSPGEWDDFQVGACTVIKEGTEYKMWYQGNQVFETDDIGYATSPDGINWTKYNDPSTTNAPFAESDPVLSGYPGDWDAKAVRFPIVIVNNSTYEMWYVAQGDTGIYQNMCYAFSVDGINWVKYNDSSTTAPPYEFSDPVMTSGSSGEFDDTYILTSSVINENNVYRMWYTGYGGSPQRWRVGYVTDSSNVVSVDDQNYFEPMIYSLSQNYPNPFNPKTVIGYQLPVNSIVTLKVYDLLGREVATLVDEYKPAGSYEVEFDASELSSGVYIYRLTTENNSASNKMTLLK